MHNNRLPINENITKEEWIERFIHMTRYIASISSLTEQEMRWLRDAGVYHKNMQTPKKYYPRRHKFRHGDSNKWQITALEMKKKKRKRWSVLFPYLISFLL